MNALFLKTLLDLKKMRERLANCVIDEDKKIWAEVGKLDEFLSRVEEVFEGLCKEILKLEIEMGRAADAINQQGSTISTQASTISSLQSGLATAQANAYDAADVAAINGVLGGNNAPSGQTNVSSGSASGGSTSNGSSGVPAGS